MKSSLAAILKTASAFAGILTVALMGFGSLAYAEDGKPSNYVAFKGGMYSPSSNFDLDNFNGGSTTHFDGKTGVDGELAIGHYFLPFLAAELGAGYFQTKGSASAQPGETMLRVVPVVATGKLILPLGIFEPYGEFGIGAYFTKLEVTGNTGNFNGSSEITYGLHAGAGFNVNVSKNVFVGLEGRYLWAKPSFGGQDVKIEGFTTTANLGLRF
jgi:opacity protein-like surface antigen